MACSESDRCKVRAITFGASQRFSMSSSQMDIRDKSSFRKLSFCHSRKKMSFVFSEDVTFLHSSLSCGNVMHRCLLQTCPTMISLGFSTVVPVQKECTQMSFLPSGGSSDFYHFMISPDWRQTPVCRQSRFVPNRFNTAIRTQSMMTH